MSKASVTVEGDERLRATANRAADELDNMQATGRGVAEVVRARAASNAPRLTGYLAGSVVVEAVTALEIVIAANAEYSQPVESGVPSRGVPARPFMANALRDTERLVIDRYSNKVSDIASDVKGA